jgi:hypothetical protein
MGPTHHNMRTVDRLHAHGQLKSALSPKPCTARFSRPERVSPRYPVYVIELDRAVMQIRAFRERNPDARSDKPCVYVGSTCRSRRSGSSSTRWA